MERELFALLRIGLETSTLENEALSDISALSSKQWAWIGEIAEKQGVFGILLDGIEACHTNSTDVSDNLPLELKLEWIGEALQVEQSNRTQIAVMNDFARKWIEEGFRVMVMKGQANSLMYPHPEHRLPGDIDCYLFDNYQLGNAIAKREGADVDESWYKHSQISYKGELFENHQYFVHTREGEKSKRLQKELEQALQIKDWRTFPQSKILLPPVQWNAMFLTYHACAHFLSEGLRLKQILDWAMFLQKEQKNVDWKAFYAYCDRYHFRRFADAMTAISVKYLGITVDNPQITTESPYVEKILKSTLFDDDYIYNVGENIWKSRWHLVRSLFKYRWKYEEIYQDSIWKQLWWYASGYVFHTE